MFFIAFNIISPPTIKYPIRYIALLIHIFSNFAHNAIINNINADTI